MVDEVLLYRYEQMISDSNLNLSSLALNSYPLLAYSMWHVQSNFDFFNYDVNAYKLPLVNVLNECEIIINNNNNEFQIKDNGVYSINICVCCTYASDASSSFKLIVNNGTTITVNHCIMKNYHNNLCFNNIISLNANDIVYVEVAQNVGGVGLFNLMSNFSICKLR